MLQDLLGPGRLTPWFQPVVSTTTQAVHRFEALVRYERADGTVLLPYQVLPALDQAGESAGLFPEMLHAALTGCRQWREAGIPAGVAVNVTTDDLHSGDLPDLVCTTLTAHGMPSSVLTLELSEQQLLAAGSTATESLARLRALDVRIAIDDFGAGHSSLSRLADVAVNELKIDRSLVTSADADPRRQIVLRSAVDLGHRLGLEVIAEGVEDDDVADTVRAVGADSIQGYLFSRPIPLTDVLQRYTPKRTVSPAPERASASSAGPATSEAGHIRRWLGLTGGRTLGIVIAYLAMYLAWILVQPGGRSVALWFGNLAYLPLNGVGIWFAIRAARASTGRSRQGWYLLAVAMSSYQVGNVLQWLYESVLHRTAFPGPPDVGYLLFYPLAMAGVLRFGRPLCDRNARRALWLDVLTVTTGVGALIMQLVLAPAVSSGEGIAGKLVASAYPLGDLLLLFAAAKVLLRGVEQAVRRPLHLLIGSAVCFALTDSIYVNSNAYDGASLLNIGWLVALAGMLLAAAVGRSVAELRSSSRFAGTGAGGPTLLRRLPYVAVTATFALLASSEYEDASVTQMALWSLALLTTLLVVLRQSVTMRTNADLVRAYDALSSSDELTGLSTRRHFLAEADREFALSLRATGADAGTALLLLDIDHFTAINEQYGQQAGDQVLTAVAEACRNQLRQGDLLGRYGGDEIIALLPNSSAETARSITCRIKEHLGGICIDTATGPVVVRISAGVAFAPAGVGLREALVQVTAGLQAAKQAGGVRSGQSEPTPVS